MMSTAAGELYDFVHSAVKGLCEKPGFSVEIMENGTREIRIFVKHNKADFLNLHSRKNAMMTLAIAIAKKHGKFVSLILD